MHACVHSNIVSELVFCSCLLAPKNCIVVGIDKNWIKCNEININNHANNFTGRSVCRRDGAMNYLWAIIIQILHSRKNRHCSFLIVSRFISTLTMCSLGLAHVKDSNSKKKTNVNILNLYLFRKLIQVVRIYTVIKCYKIQSNPSCLWCKYKCNWNSEKAFQDRKNGYFKGSTEASFSWANQTS